MPKPQKPKDLMVANGWYMELPGLLSPHFETLEGVGRETESVEIVDAGTNIKHKFSSQLLSFTDMTLTRTRQNNAEDAILTNLVFECAKNGLKIPAVAVKMHNGVEVFRLVFDGFRFMNETYPTFDVNSAEKFTMSYTATCDGYEEV